LELQTERKEAKAIATKGERVYRRLRRQLERKYPGMAVAIDWEQGEVAAIGRSLDEADEKAAKARPGKTFYFRKIGEDIFVFLTW
jgi:hypothetical protein